MSDFMNKATEIANDLKDKVEELTDKLPDTVKDKVGQAKDKAGELMDKLPDSVKEKMELVKDRLKASFRATKTPTGSSDECGRSVGGRPARMR